MRHTHLRPTRLARTLGCILVLGTLTNHSPAALTDLATAPLETSTGSLVKPNILFVLDDSGSMTWDFLPDWANTTTDALARNAGYNGIYYDPGINYLPPLKYDGSSYPSMTSANTSSWSQVPYDGFGVQTPSNIPNTGTDNLFTNASSGTTQNLVGSAYYYTFIPGEYCSSPSLQSCATLTTPNDSYPYPTKLRWCTSTALTTCRATRIDTGTTTYTNARYPGQVLSNGTGATATLSLSSASGSPTPYVSGITINGAQIMSASSTSSTSTTTLATSIRDAINACTSAATGSCTTTGYSATVSGSQVTIKAPSSLCTMPTGAPAYVKTGTVTVTTTNFTTGVNATCVPGSNQRTTITSTVTSYPYPGSTAKATDRSDCAGTTCTYAEEMTNYANWWAYYRMRMQMAKSAASISFSGINAQRRLGYMSINNNTGSDFLNVAEASTASGGQKAQWYAKFVAAKPGGSTPLRTALSLAGRYYAGKTSKINGITTTDPMQYSCQRNYTILSTDGYWNESTSPVKIDGSTAVGDQDSATSVSRPQFDGNATSNTLADVSYYYYNTDIRDSAYTNTNGVLGSDVANNNVPDKQQRMYTSTVGLGASGYMRFQSNYATAKIGDYYDVKQGTATSTTTAGNGICTWQTTGMCNWPKAVSNTQTTIDDLWHAAVNGGGIYFSATNPADLKDGLTTFLQKVDGATSDAAAATTSNPNVSSSDNFIFKSTFRSSDWYGEMTRYRIDITTGALTTIPDWGESGTIVKADGVTPYTPPLLDNKVWTTRRIYTYNPAAGDSLITFDWTSLTATMQGYFKVAAISSLQQMCSSGAVCLDASVRVDSDTNSAIGAGGKNLVNFLRGDRTNEGPDTGTYYRQRVHVLGDIVDSQAVYVSAPQFNYIDSGYAAFKYANKSRTPTLYVGANDGMLHAFNGETGDEVWSYIPSMVLPNLYKLADKNYAGNHNFYINATPRQGDVYYDGSWHTILVSGLGAGGRGFFALDVSNPVTPKVLWEFTHDTSKGTGYTTDADLGYSYGQPLITKLSDGTWVVIVTSGYNNVSPGNAHGIVWVLNAKTGVVIKKIDTGAGSTTAAVAGCSAAPCPAGLAKISAYVENGGANNTALRIYGGDLLGNVWRINLTSLTVAGGTADVQLLATLANASNVRQPVTGRPEVGNVGGKPVVFVGTGVYLGVSDVSTTGQQSIYAILDPLTSASGASGLYGSPRGNTCTASIKTNCFVKQTLTDSAGNIRTATSTVSYAVDFTTMYGWYVDLPETGERANTDPDLQLGTLAYTTNIPSSSTACSVGGSSYINFLDYRTGLTVPGSDRIGNLLTNGSTTALATAPTLVRLPNGKVISITNLSDGSTVTTNAPISATNLRTRRVSWRELISTN